MTLGEQIREARKKVGMTQAVLSRRSGVSLFTIQTMEQNKHMPSLENLLKVTKELRGSFVFDCGGTPITLKVKW